MDDAGEQTLVRWRVVFAMWTVPALLSIFETVTFAHVNGQDIALWRALVSEAPAWYVWAALTPVVIALGRRFPLDHGPRSRRAGAAILHLTASLVAGLLYAAVACVSGWWARPPHHSFGIELFDWWVTGLPLIVLSYFSIVGVGYAVARAREAARLRNELAVAQLGALRAQMHPHFLFNTLNAITALVRDNETRGALDMLSLLSDLLRSVLTGDTTDEITLGEEIVFLEKYLGIMAVRFSDRLRVTWDVPDALREARVPMFVLQPLVENAIRHGISRRTEAGRVEIAARRTDDRLVLTVRNDGPVPNPEIRGGLGLRNTRERLARLYGDATVTLAAGDRTHGAVATITMPYV